MPQGRGLAPDDGFWLDGEDGLGPNTETPQSGWVPWPDPPTTPRNPPCPRPGTVDTCPPAHSVLEPAPGLPLEATRPGFRPGIIGIIPSLPQGVLPTVLFVLVLAPGQHPCHQPWPFQHLSHPWGCYPYCGRGGIPGIPSNGAQPLHRTGR